MNRLIMFLLILLPSLSVKAQIYTDPEVAAATGAHASVMNRQLDHVNDNLTLIQRGQLAVTGQLQIVNDLQDKIYKRTLRGLFCDQITAEHKRDCWNYRRYY